MSLDWKESPCWMDHYRAALKRRRVLGWSRGARRFVTRTTVAIGFIFATAMLLAFLIPV